MGHFAEFYGRSFLSIVLMDDESMFSQHSFKITLMFLKPEPGNKNVTFEVQRPQFKVQGYLKGTVNRRMWKESFTLLR